MAGLATVSGKPFYGTDMVWDNGEFPYRIPIKFLNVLNKDQRIPILGEVRDILMSEWGPKYGWGMLNQQIIQDNGAQTLIKTITVQPNALKQIEANLDELLEDAKQQRETPAKKIVIREQPPKTQMKEKEEQQSEEPESNEEGSLHSQAEHALIKIGKATGCKVCIALNDKSKLFQGKPLSEQCLKSLPNFGLNEEATRRIGLIDIIWVINNSPVCAFEIETTTSVYSGLLRMSDLLSVVPSLKIKLYIVAPRIRQDKVRSEITRPTFQKIGLNEYCRFIPIEELNKLLSRIEGLQGHIQPTIIDTIAVTFEDEKTETY